MKIGTGELLLILGLALIVMGPSKLPELGKFLGETLFVTKKYLGELTEEINEEVKKPIEESLSPLTEMTKPLEDALKFDNILKPEPAAEVPQLEAATQAAETLPRLPEDSAATTGDASGHPRRLSIKRNVG